MAAMFGNTSDVLYILCCSGLQISETQLDLAAAACVGKTGGRNYRNAYSLLSVICNIAELEYKLQSGQGADLTSEALEGILDKLLYRMNGWYIVLLNHSVFQRKLLGHLISLDWKLSAPLQTLLLEELSMKASQWDDPLLFGEYWRYLHLHKRDSILRAYFDNWLGNTGRIWKEELSDREILAQPLLEMADELNWNAQAGEARRLLFIRRIGYVGRKDYSLYDPLKWFQRVAEQKPEIWQQEGLLLMNLSEYASNVGDNRALVPVLSAVAGAAGQMGAGSLLQFAGMKQESSIPWKDVVFDGVIAALETCEPSREELTALWKCAAEYFMVYPSLAGYDSQGERDKIYAADIHEAIRLCAKRMGYDGMEPELRAIAPNQFEQPRISRSETNQIVTERWYDKPQAQLEGTFWEEVGSKDLDRAFEVVCQQHECSYPDWSLIAQFIHSAEQRGPDWVARYKPRIIEQVQLRDRHSNLEADGCWRVYDALFPHLDKEDVTLLIQNVVRSYQCRSEDGWPSAGYGLATDLSHVVFALFSRYGLAENLAALREILEMHCIWLTGGRTFALSPQYELKDCAGANNWTEFCKTLTLFGFC